MTRATVLLALLLTPSFAFAAGFAQDTIFLSRSPVTEGEVVRIYAVVTNAATTTFTGNVIIREGEDIIGNTPVSLAAGATQTASVQWTPTAGKHTIVAQLTSSTGVAEERSEIFQINPKPTPVSAGSVELAAVESSDEIQQQIADLSPQAADIVAPVFSAIDSVRDSIAGIADKQIEATKPKIEPSESEQTQGWMSMVYTVYFYILTLVRYVVGSAAVFYPVLAVLFLYFLWKMFRRFARPSY